MINTGENQPRTNPQRDVWVETGIHGKSWKLESLLNILIIIQGSREMKAQTKRYRLRRKLMLGLVWRGSCILPKSASLMCCSGFTWKAIKNHSEPIRSLVASQFILPWFLLVYPDSPETPCHSCHPQFSLPKETPS